MNDLIKDVRGAIRAAVVMDLCERTVRVERKMERVEVEAKDIVRRECDGISWSYQGKHKGSITRAMRIGG